MPAPLLVVAARLVCQVRRGSESEASHWSEIPLFSGLAMARLSPIDRRKVQLTMAVWCGGASERDAAAHPMAPLPDAAGRFVRSAHQALGGTGHSGSTGGSTALLSAFEKDWAACLTPPPPATRSAAGGGAATAGPPPVLTADEAVSRLRKWMAVVRLRQRMARAADAPPPVRPIVAMALAALRHEATAHLQQPPPPTAPVEPHAPPLSPPREPTVAAVAGHGVALAPRPRPTPSLEVGV